MAVEPLPPNGWAPLEVGVQFRLGNSDLAGQWVEIVAVDSKNVYVKGINGHKADLVIPRWKFDDVVSDADVRDASGTVMMGFFFGGGP